MLLENQTRFDVPNDMETAIALGYVSGWSIFSVWNENASVSTTQEEMSNVGGIRTLPSVAGALSIVSSATTDTAAGTGARTVLITYLDSDYLVQQVLVTLNGITPVNANVNAIRFRNAIVVTSGANNDPDGNLTIAIGGVTQAIIFAGQNESRETGYTVPGNKKFLSTHAVIATGRGGSVDVDVAFEYRLFGSSVWYTLRSLQLYQAFAELAVVGVAALPPKSDFRVLATATGGAGPACYVQARGYEIETRVLPGG